MNQLPRLNWLLFQRLPLSGKEPVIHLNIGLTNQIITPLLIKVHNLNLKCGRTWERNHELEKFVELRRFRIFLVEVTLVELDIPTLYN